MNDTITDKELKQHIERQISCTLRHFRGDSIKNAKKSELRRESFQQTFVQYLGLKTRQKQEDQLRQGWYLYLKNGVSLATPSMARGGHRNPFDH